MKFVSKSSLTIIAILALVFSFSAVSFAEENGEQFPRYQDQEFWPDG